MNEKVVAFLKRKDEIIKKDRDQLLVKLGLVQKVYSPNNQETYEYSKYDYKNGEKMYYKEIALDVTEDEYAEIVKKVKLIEEINTRDKSEYKLKNNKNYIQALTPFFELPKDTYSYHNDSNNGKCELSNILRIIAWSIWLLGFFTGIVAAFNGSILFIFVIWVSSFISGIMLYAIAQILDYLALVSTILQRGHKFIKVRK